ncbi:putative bifunctional diguanylate cyclase/phosphodiesterase [Nitrincola sp. MINF-07-Sa-05]|uniref:putative bifunctional diguanylate cyclase/phosphodiesterase n=1 Tax=Nitrincola salilacus TaxID=3400273 RepID=UPI003918443F
MTVSNVKTSSKREGSPSELLDDQVLLRQQTIIEAANQMIATIAADQQLIYLNTFGRQLLGVAQDHDLLAQPLYVHDFHLPATYSYLNEEVFPKLKISAGRWDGELELKNLQGELIPSHMTIVAHLDAQGEVAWITGIAKDLRLRRQYEAQQRLALRVFDNTIEGIMVTDAQARILQVNQAFVEITGFTEEEVLGRTPKMLRSEHHDEYFYDAMWDQVEVEGRWQGEIWNRRKDGGVFLQWLSINCLKDPQGKTQYYVSVFHDLTEMRAKEAEISHLSSHDPLTGLGNRHLLNERMQHAIRQARRQHSRLALMAIDLGEIQLINESLGHVACDRLIQSQGKKLAMMMEDSVTVVRFGADEFTVLIEDVMDPYSISQLAQKVRKSLQEAVEVDGHRVRLSPSLGIAFYPEDAADEGALLRNAQVALNQAKQSGRDTFRFYDQNMGQEARERLMLEQALRDAITQNALELHYQPKVSLNTGAIYGAEALLRWNHPMLGSISPAVFIPIAEVSGLIVEIGYWVFRDVCRQLSLWREQGLKLPRIAVNMSVQQLEREDLLQQLLSSLQAHHLPVDALELEITETGLMKSEGRALSCVQALSAEGFRLALDDFGTGYSSLSYLRRLPLSTLKIDRSFISDMQSDRVALSIVKTIIQLSRDLGLDVVAEGVELSEQADQLRDMGCDLVQGFFFYRPMSAGQFQELLLPLDETIEH